MKPLENNHAFGALSGILKARKIPFIVISMLLLNIFLLLAPAFSQKMDVQAHRGGLALMPENTIPAMLNAINLGVKTLEFDCVISKDNKVVVSHDLFMSSNFMLKPDGSEISKAEEKQLLLYKMPYDSIKQYDAGMKPHPLFPNQKKYKAYRPLLSELLDSVETYVRTLRLKPIYYTIEIKSRLSGDNVSHPAPDEFVTLVMDVIMSKKIVDRVTIQSFDDRPLRVLRQKYPKVEVSYLITKGQENYKDNIKKLGFVPEYLSLSNSTISAEYVNEAHRNGVKMISGVVNEIADMRKMEAMHVDGIITDYPNRAVQIFGKYQ